MRVETTGSKDLNIMLVGEAPGENEARTGRPFHPGAPAGGTLDRVLTGANTSRHDCIITNVAKEKPPGNKIAFFFEDKKCTTPKPILLEWIEELKRDIIKYDPNIIVALGSIACKILTGENSISAARGYIYPCDLVSGYKVLPTYHPQKINYEWNLFPIVVLDIRKALTHSKNKKLDYDKKNLEFDVTKTQFISYCKYLLTLDTPVAVDIETIEPNNHIDIIGLANSSSHGVSFQFIKNRKAILSPENEAEVWLALNEVHSKKYLIMQNGLYDAVVLAKNNGIICNNYCYDTLIAAHVCWPEFPRSLRFLASIILNVPAWKDTSQEAPLYYNCSDAVNTYAIWESLHKELVKQKDTEVFSFEMSQVFPAMMLQMQGLYVNEEERKKLLIKINTDIEEIRENVSEVLGREIIVKADKKKKNALNISSSKQLASLLYVDLGLETQFKRRKSIQDTRKITTDAEALMKLARKHPENNILNKILTLKKKIKLLTFVDISVSPENKVHTCYNVTGATTLKVQKGLVVDSEDSFKSFGRWSSSKSIIYPWGSGNLQNIPKEARKIYTAPEGYEILQADYIQAEAVVVAYLIHDYKVIKMFKEAFGLTREEKEGLELDIHKLTASFMLKIAIEDVNKEQRTRGKLIRHATNYSAGPNVLAHTLQIPVKEAKTLLTKFHLTTPQLKLWHKSIDRELRQKRSLTNLLGRKHRFLGRWDSSMLKSAYAYIPQSTVGDLLNKALVTFYTKYGNVRDIILQLHDAIYILSPLEKREESKQMLKDCMLTELEVEGKKFTVDIDFSAGQNWGELEDV